jgi:hypothetical protein
VVWFAAQGVTVQRVLTDNGSCYRSRAWREACANTDVTHKRTRPYRPQTNGKVERFHRTLLVEWAYVRPYPSEQARVAALPGGCTSTTITAPTPHSAATHPPAASPTCRARTPSRSPQPSSARAASGSLSRRKVEQRWASSASPMASAARPRACSALRKPRFGSCDHGTGP